MTLPVIEWPDVSISADDLHLVGQTLTSKGIFGAGTVIHMENRVWVLSLPVNALYEKDWRKIRATLDEARGQYGRIRVPIWTTGIPTGEGGVTFDADVTFDTDVIFLGVSLIGAAALEASPSGATRLTVSSPVAALVEPAMPFSIGDRLYRVARADGEDIVFNPPLREAVSAGAALEFVSPRMLMRLTADDAAMPIVASRMSSPTTFTLTEAF